MKLILMIVGLALASSVACGSTRGNEPRVSAMTLTTKQRHGQALFHQFCHQCHPNGDAGLGPAINSNPAPMAAFRLQVRNGLGAMPSFPDAIIPDQDLDLLLAFVAVQRERDD
jgi:mono/diheme cytochrome c family protein